MDSTSTKLRPGSPSGLIFTLLVIFLTSYNIRAEDLPRTDAMFKNESIEKVLDFIRKKFGYEFIYNNDVFNKEQRVTLEMKNATAKELLEKVLGDKYTFTMVDHYVVISLRAKQGQKEKPETLLRGKVTGDDGESLAGASVMIKGMGIGTVTDSNGNYVLSVPDDAGIIVISFIGYKTQEIPFSGQTLLDVILKVDISTIGEVVITAYGQQNEREVIGSISSISGKDLVNVPTSNISNLLQGRAAGVNVINSSGSPGGGGISISIRGFNSLSVESARRTSEPLWVIDGVPVMSFTSPVTGTNTMSEINPEDIESVQILKDAASASIYGSRAANGVILVTTKKGREGKTRISANVSQTYTFTPQMPDVTGGNMERRFRIEAAKNYRQSYSDAANKTFVLPTSYEESAAKNADYDYFWGKGIGAGSAIMQDSLNPFYNNSTNWFDYYFQVGKVTNANFQLNGGSSSVRYNVGLGVYDEDGVIVSTNFNRINLLTNIDITPNKKFYLGLRLTANRTDRDRGINANESFLKASSIEQMPSAPLATSTLYPGVGTEVYDKTLQAMQDIDEKIIGYRFRTNVVASYELIKNLQLKTSVSLDQSQQLRNFFRPSYLLDADGRNESITVGEIERNMSILNENLITYKHSFNENAHVFDFLLGQSAQIDDFEYMGGSARNGPSDLIKYSRPGFPLLRTDANGITRGLQEYQSNYTRSALVSYFGRVNYNHKMKYFLSYTLRRDGSSRFGENVRYATFPSYSAGWAFTEESFMKDLLPFLDYGKIRASYGVSGMQFSQPYLAYGLLTTADPFLGYPTTQPNYNNGLFNPQLTWEETDQYDLGLNLDMFDEKLGITADYYYRFTDKLLYETRLPGTYSGYQNQWQNAYAVSNEGIELQIKADILNRGDLSWRMSFNIARNWNLLRKSYSDNDWRYFTGQDQQRYVYNMNVVGKPLNGIVVFRNTGIYQSGEEIPYTYDASGTKVPLHGNNLLSTYGVGDPIYYDANGDGQIQSSDQLRDDRIYVGSPLPKAHGGIVNEVHWKNFDLNVLFNYVLHRTILNTGAVSSLATSTQKGGFDHPILLDLRSVTFWEKPGDITDYGKNQIENGKFVFNGATEQNVEDVSYIKLKTITLGYTLPTSVMSRIKLQSARVFVSGENLATFTNYTGPDPEAVDVVTGVDAVNNYPLSRRLTLGLTLNF